MASNIAPGAPTAIHPQVGPLELEVGETWKYRELLYFFVWRDIKIRYKQTLIGAGWAIIQPFFTMLIFTLFFGRLAKIPSEGLPYPVFYYSALLPWMYFANAVNTATNSMVEHQRMITKIYFPKILLPASSVLAGLIDLAIGLAMGLGLALYFRLPLTLNLLYLPLFTALAVLTALAISLWSSSLNVVYRDVRYAIPFIIQFWMFASPVVYSSSLIPDRWRWLYGLNPMAGVIEGFRWALGGHPQPPAAIVLASTAAVTLIGLGGLLYFRRTEGTLADVV